MCSQGENSINILPFWKRMWQRRFTTDYGKGVLPLNKFYILMRVNKGSTDKSLICCVWAFCFFCKTFLLLLMIKKTNCTYYLHFLRFYLYGLVNVITLTFSVTNKKDYILWTKYSIHNIFFTKIALLKL